MKCCPHPRPPLPRTTQDRLASSPLPPSLPPSLPTFTRDRWNRRATRDPPNLVWLNLVLAKLQSSFGFIPLLPSPTPEPPPSPRTPPTHHLFSQITQLWAQGEKDAHKSLNQIIKLRSFKHATWHASGRPEPRWIAESTVSPLWDLCSSRDAANSRAAVQASIVVVKVAKLVLSRDPTPPRPPTPSLPPSYTSI